MMIVVVVIGGSLAVEGEGVDQGPLSSLLVSSLGLTAQLAGGLAPTKGNQNNQS